MRKFLGILALLVVVGACNNMINGSDDEPTTSSTAAGSSSSAPYTYSPRTSAPRATTAAPVPVTTAAAPGVGPGEQVIVAYVVDGDTFETTDGRRVRLLGIDSCEIDTPGGRDARAAAMPLQGGNVILRTEPGVDLDQYDRHLRYVQTMVNGQLGDYGQYMVQFDHTGVYQGDNDASARYVQQLYAADLVRAASPPSGRECGQPDPPPPPAPDVDVDVDRTDDDDDNGGGEGRFCRGRWWC